ILAIRITVRPAQRGDERQQRDDQRSDVEQAPPGVPRLPRIDPEQHGQDQEPRREQDQRQVGHGGQVHALASSAARIASSACATSLPVTPSPSTRSASGPEKPPRLSAATRWPASFGESKPRLSSNRRSPSTSLKWKRPSLSRYCLNTGSAALGERAPCTSLAAAVDRSRRPTACRSSRR